MKLSSFFACALILATALLSGCGDSGSNYYVLPGLTVTDFKNSSTVVGQATFTSYSSMPDRAVAAYTNEGANGSPLIYNGILYVPDSSANRILGYNSIPTTNGASANFVLGQTDFTSSSSATTDRTLSGPVAVRASNGKMFVAEFENSRILIWNTPPTTNGAPADVVVGQPGFTSNACTTSQSGLCNPDDMFVVGTKLIVGDSTNNRVLIWNTIPTTNGASADVVLGQNDFIKNVSNDVNQNGTDNGTPSNSTLSYPAGVWSDGTRLVVCDRDNHRVLIWNKFPTTNFAAADVVVGQSSFSLNNPNDDNQNGTTNISARTLNQPYYVTSNGSQLFIADSSNNRVLMWDSIPTSSFAPASKVLGQSSFTVNAPNDDNQDGTPDANPTARTLSFPNGLYLYGQKLFVSDHYNKRYLIFSF